MSGADDAVSWAEDSFRISRGMVFFARDAGGADLEARVVVIDRGRGRAPPLVAAADEEHAQAAS